MLFLDGVYIRGSGDSATRFAWVKAPASDELTQLTASARGYAIFTAVKLV